MFEDPSDNVSNVGHTGVVFTCCRLPFAAPRGQGGQSNFIDKGAVVFGK